MLRGMYTATAGMVSQMSAIDLLTNNVANANTMGFKEDFETLVRQDANPQSYGEGGQVRGTGVLSLKTGVNLTQGSLQSTGNPLDLALQGPGMFGLQTAQGVVYARNGRFHLSSAGQVVTEAGNVLLDASGKPLSLPDPQGSAVTIREDGTVTVGNTTAGQVGVFTAANWNKAGNWVYAPTGRATAITTTPIKQGMLEQGNVDLVSVMGSIMSAERSYEASSQIQRTIDQMAQQAANDVGKV